MLNSTKLYNKILFFLFTIQDPELAKQILVEEMLFAKTVQMELIVAFVRKATRVILSEDVLVRIISAML